MTALSEDIAFETRVLQTTSMQSVLQVVAMEVDTGAWRTIRANIGNQIRRSNFTAR